MTYLADMIGGKSETDLEKAIDRFFLYKGMGHVADRFLDPNKRKRELEEKLLERYLDSDTALQERGSDLAKLFAYGRKPAISIAQALMR
jgi:hypothetical protein